MNLTEVIHSPLFGITVTLLAYTAAIGLNHKMTIRIHPLLLSTIMVIMFLQLLQIPVSDYQEGGQYLTLMLGPATVALAVPMYKYFPQIRKNFASLLTAIGIGSLSGIVGTMLIMWLTHASKMMLATTLPKSVTAPVAAEWVRLLGGNAELGTALTVITGLTGSIMGPWLLKIVRVHHDLAIGAAIGTSSHGIGTAKLVRENEAAGSVSGFAMGLAALLTSMMLMLLHLWM